MARWFVDGIDRKKAAELTNALRLHGVALEMVRSRRDESEPIIRLADMWAGCIRRALLGKPEGRALLQRALESNYIRRIKEKTLESRGFSSSWLFPARGPISADTGG